MASTWSRIMTGLRAFRDAFLDADTTDFTDTATWGDFDARKVRYAILWAFYQGTGYRDINQWAKSLKVTHGLYKWVRAIANPAFEIGEFHKGNIWSGRLMLHNEDGELMAMNDGALPIAGTDDDALRVAIARLLIDSNFKSTRKIITLYGTVYGDVGIEVVDDPKRNKVYLRVVHPSMVKGKVTDDFGNVKGYTIEYKRSDDLNPSNEVTYTEIVSRPFDDELGSVVLYETFKNDVPYAWGGDLHTWEQPLGFVPMVFIKHRDVGLDWGMSEYFPKLQLFWEVDDQNSKLNDQIRKSVDAKWIALGVNAPQTTPTLTQPTATASQPQKGRDESPIIYLPGENASLEPLVAPLDLTGALENLKNIQETIEKAFPELSLHKVRTEGTGLSGTAIRNLQRDAENKIYDLRDTYDDALTRAIQMAIAIGGERGYKGYEGFSLGSYGKGDLNFTIGNRPVFSQDIAGELDNDTKRAEIFSTLSGVTTVEAAAEIAGYNQDEIELMKFTDTVTGVEQ